MNQTMADKSIRIVSDGHPLRTSVVSYAHAVRAATEAAGTACGPITSGWDRGVEVFFVRTQHDHERLCASK